jgi:hypothetical protein
MPAPSYRYWLSCLLAIGLFGLPVPLCAASKLILKAVWTGDPKVGVHEIAVQVVDATGDLQRGIIDQGASPGARDASCFTLLARQGKAVKSPRLTLSGADRAHIYLQPQLPEQAEKYKFFLIIKSGCVKLTQPVSNAYEDVELELSGADFVRNEKFFRPYPETKLALLQGDKAGAFSAQVHYRHALDPASDTLIHASITADGSIRREEKKHYLNKLEAELGGYWTRDLKDSGLVELGVSSKLQADRDFTTVDETFGLSLWSWVPWFDGFARALFLTGDATRPPFQNQPLLLAGYDFVAHLKREENQPRTYDGQHRLHGRLYWPIPIAREVPLLIVDRKIGLDLIIDLAGICDLAGGRVAPESKIALDFLLDDSDTHPALTLSYVNGRVAPKFEHFNAFLAGFKYAF